MPEQLALPAAKGDVSVGLTLAALTVTGGFTGAIPELAAFGRGLVKVGVNAWTAYRGASAAYSTAAAMGTGAVIGGGAYTGSSLFGAFYDWQFGSGQSFDTGFDQRFSFSGLGASMALGSATGTYSTAMFRWAGIPNALSNVATVPGAVIRVNSAVMGKAAGAAVHSALESSTGR